MTSSKTSKKTKPVIPAAPRIDRTVVNKYEVEEKPSPPKTYALEPLLVTSNLVSAGLLC